MRAAALRNAAEPKILDLLDLVALGTVADVARLKGLNRAFVTQGLKSWPRARMSVSRHSRKRRGW